jgi:hypothetical protein
MPMHGIYADLRVGEGLQEIVMTREAHPNRAAERRKTLATGASPWLKINLGLTGLLPNLEMSNTPLRFQGGVDARSIRSREATLTRAAGVVIQESRSAPYLLNLLTTPAAPRRNRTIFVGGAASPPWKGGECCLHQPFALFNVERQPLKPGACIAAPRFIRMRLRRANV